MMDGQFDDTLTGEQKIRNFNINFGPQHPATHTTLRIVLDLKADAAQLAMAIGVRIATLSIIGIGTIASFINAGGLGTLLFQGVSSGQRPKIVAGSIAVALLALFANQILRFFEYRISLPLRENG